MYKVVVIIKNSITEWEWSVADIIKKEVFQKISMPSNYYVRQLSKYRMRKDITDKMLESSSVSKGDICSS